MAKGREHWGEMGVGVSSRCGFPGKGIDFRYLERFFTQEAGLEGAVLLIRAPITSWVGEGALPLI